MIEKKLLTILAILFFSFKYSLAQIQKLDSLEKAISTNTYTDKEKYDVQLKIGSLYIENKLKEAKPIIENTIKLAKKTANPVDIGFAYHQRANYHEKLGEFDEGLNDVSVALTYADNSIEGQKLYIYSNATKGVILRRQSKYEDAYAALLTANAKAEETKNDTLIYTTLTQLGIISVTMKNYDQAMDYHKQAIEIATRLKNNRKISKSYGNIGIIYRELKKYDEGIEYNLKALEYAKLSGDSSSISFAMSEMGTMYDRAGQSPKATPYLLESIAIRERNNEQNELAYSYFYLASNYSRMGKIAESEMWMRKGMAQAEKIKNIKQVLDAYHMYYLTFERNKKLDSAIFYIKTYVEMKDSVSGEEVKEKIAELNIKYDSQKKDLKLKDEKLKNTYLLSGVGVLLFGIFLLFGAYRRRKLRYDNKLQETLIHEQNKSTKAIIEAEENERQRIASDLHDGVGQYMTAAKMNLESLNDKLPFSNEKDKETFNNALKMLVDSVSEVRSISHNMMPNALLKNGLGNAVRTFLDSINQQKLKVQLFTDGLNIPIDTNTEIFLYRIIQECVNNVFKHADASELNITILVDQNELDVTIEDNGKGFNPDELKDKSGIGVTNIKKRVQFLKGNVHWDSVPGKGTTVVMNIPMNALES